MRDWKSYQKWSRERNPKRKALEVRCGYDSKHASHLVRLLRMALEILSTGEVHVHRPDGAELLGIRQGDWDYERLMEHVRDLEARLPGEAEASTLPKSADHKGLAELYLNIVEKTYGIRV